MTLTLLAMIPMAPLIGFIVLALFGSVLSKKQSAFIGVFTVGYAAVVTLIVVARFLLSPPQGGAFTQTLWTWIALPEFNPSIAFRIDALSCVMITVITFVGFLIHLYSAEFMEEDRDVARFFASMNLFVASMLILVMADNLLLLYLGWEGVGLCSYLLIGFWYEDPENGHAAMKAFIVTRIGDTAMAIGLYLIFLQLGTLGIKEIEARAPLTWGMGSGTATAAAALLLGGALGKSAQLPLQTWLPDAMAGPTPVSALIHAATMVTAGVYLIARMHVLFELAPAVQTAVAVIGALTLLVAGSAALAQHDIKRVLAYSTISQIGYMFVALGVGAYSAAMFHFMTHAFFKALLFLGAGVLIHCLHDEHNMFRMGGLRKLMPVTFWTFAAGAASLSALPLVTAGFYSKDLIIARAWSSDLGSPWLYAAALLGAFITALYTFRMLFVTFYGTTTIVPARKPGWKMTVPLLVLAVLSIVGGFVETPGTLGHVSLFSDFLRTVMADASVNELSTARELLLEALAVLAVAVGLGLAYVIYLKKPSSAESLLHGGAGQALDAFLKSGWGFDRLYDVLLVKPYRWIARVGSRDVVDVLPGGIAAGIVIMYRIASATENGHLRRYAAAIAAGAAIIVAIMVFT